MKQARDVDEPKPTDIDERLIALRRKTASRAKPPSRSPQLVVSQPDADPDDFNRRLKISPSPSQRPHTHAPSKLYNPDRDPVPIVRRPHDAEVMSDAASSAYAPRPLPNGSAHGHGHRPDPAARQLFDHTKDDPVRFSVLTRPHGRPVPTPKSSGDYISASSISSYAPSQASSSFTLSSNTDGSSASSALFDGRSKPSESQSTNVFAIQLKKLYRAITTLETKVKGEDADENDDSSRILITRQEPIDDEAEKEKWRLRLDDHKRLVEITHNLLEISLSPSVPTSLRNIPTKYNIIARLWTFGFYKLLESLRQASFSSPLALEHLQDFIYYAYTFYTGLLEEPNLASFKSGWLEALGDLARYKMAVSALVSGSIDGGNALTDANVSKAAAASDALAPPKADDAKSISDEPVAPRIDDSHPPSVGLAAARAMELEPEKERWRVIAREWYAAGLADQPGTGKLHHHIGLLSREVEGEELRGVYHYVKSMTTLHPFATSRESILPLFSPAAQANRSTPDAKAADLFVLLHGMIFTNINLDDFAPTLARFIERLEIEEIEEKVWAMMSIVNVAAVFEYGKPHGVIRKFGGVTGTTSTRVMSKKSADDDKMDVDETPIATEPHIPAASSPTSSQEYPQGLTHSLTLTFSMLSFVLKHPTRKPTPYALKASVNPYLTVIMTFLATVLKQPGAQGVLEKYVPWEELAAFFSTSGKIPRGVWESQGLLSSSIKPREDRWPMLTSNMAPPLPEDWCLRGMEWVGRKVFERGYWSKAEDRKMEIEFLDESEVGLGDDGTDGHIESDDGEDADPSAREKKRELDVNTRRWVRVVRSAVGIADAVEGFTWTEGTRRWHVEGSLAEKVAAWKEQARQEKLEEERRRMRKPWGEEDDDMDIDDDAPMAETTSEESDEDEDMNDSDEVKALKVRRRYLKSLLKSAEHSSLPAPPSPTAPRRRKRPHSISLTAKPLASSLPIACGYTVLIVDTNILLSSLSMFASLVESLEWTIIVPLPVVMELDGLVSNPSQLGIAASDALSYLTSHMKSHGVSLKVQTSKGNYLMNLNVRTEEVDFSASHGNGSADVQRNMDDLILKAAIWQEEHWIDRSSMLRHRNPAPLNGNPVKVVLLTLDRNLRLKARSRQLPAASQKDLAAILSYAT